MARLKTSFLSMKEQEPVSKPKLALAAELEFKSDLRPC